MLHCLYVTCHGKEGSKNCFQILMSAMTFWTFSTSKNVCCPSRMSKQTGQLHYVGVNWLSLRLWQKVATIIILFTKVVPTVLSVGVKDSVKRRTQWFTTHDSQVECVVGCRKTLKPEKQWTQLHRKICDLSRPLHWMNRYWRMIGSLREIQQRAPPQWLGYECA